MLINEGSGSGGKNSILNTICPQKDTDKIYLYAKDAWEAKYQLIINKKENKDLKHLNYSKAFIEWYGWCL